MKIIISESQYEKLFKDLPSFLKRRMDLDDLEWFDKQLPSFILHTPPSGLDFEDYSSFIVGDLLHEFIIELKGDEIETEEDPDYGVIYNEKSRNKVMEMYWDLKPILEKRYKDRLYQSWEKRR